MTREQHREEQLRRVAMYLGWLRDGMRGKIPCVPRDADFKVWNEVRAAEVAREQRRDDCPQCGAQRTELIVAPGRFHCTECQAATDGPAPLHVGSQLTIDQAPVA